MKNYGVKNFRHICIMVKDLDRSLKFYRDIMRFKVAKILDLEGEYPQKLFNIKGIRLTYVKMYSPGQPKGSPPVFELHYWKKPRIYPRKNRIHISFTVTGIDREYKRLRKLGVKFISGPVKTPYNNTKICFAYDPDNNLIEFVEDIKKER